MDTGHNVRNFIDRRDYMTQSDSLQKKTEVYDTFLILRNVLHQVDTIV
jgi:hypothetical protein